MIWEKSNFVGDVMLSENEEAKRLLRLLGIVETSEVCRHDWHSDGTVNGATFWHCQNCGVERRAKNQ
jgi:hypothetical protein